jgi:mono/diheme cytochrome c family protein
MPRVKIALAAALVTIGVSLSPARADEADDIAKGRQLATTLCAQCHLNEGQGEKQGPMGVPGFVAVANRPDQTFGGIVRWLKAVPPMMPDHHLTLDEIDKLAAFIMSLRKAPQP